VSTKPPQLADAAEHVAGREIELGHLYSLVAPLSPSRRRHLGPLHYYKHAGDTGTRFHPSPAAETANGEEQNHRPGRRRSEEPKSPPFSPLGYCSEGIRKEGICFQWFVTKLPILGFITLVSQKKTISATVFEFICEKACLFVDSCWICLLLSSIVCDSLIQSCLQFSSSRNLYVVPSK
jgi:hypothetical protein